MSEKVCLKGFVQNSIINCVYHKRHKNKKSTSLHEIFDVVFGNVCFVIVIFNIHGRKIRSSESSQNSMSEKSTFGQFEVFSSTYNFFQGGVLFSCYSTQEQLILRKDELCSWSQKKVIQFSAKVLILAIFDHLGPPSKSIFSTYKQNFKKSLVGFLGKIVRNIEKFFELPIFKRLRRGGASRFASRLFPKSVTLASCKFVERPIIACYAYSIVIFHFSQK